LRLSRRFSWRLGFGVLLRLRSLSLVSLSQDSLVSLDRLSLGVCRRVIRGLICLRRVDSRVVFRRERFGLSSSLVL